MAKRLVISASPRAMGRSARTAKEFAALLASRFPDDEVETIRLPDFDIRFCMGCNTCSESQECFIEDDMGAIMDALASADSLFIVSPIFFAGPPANYKAMLDRLQPFFWTWEKGLPKRPAWLIAIGDGGDPNGHEPLVTCTRSALAVAGFQLLGTLSRIGADVNPVDIAREVENDLFADGE